MTKHHLDNFSIKQNDFKIVEKFQAYFLFFPLSYSN